MSLADDLVADLAVFVNPLEFGTVVVRHKRDGTTTTFNGDFDDAMQGVSPVTLQVETTEPQLVCATADLVDFDKKAETLTIAGTDYRVLGVEPDGTGVSRLRLSLVRSS